MSESFGPTPLARERLDTLAISGLSVGMDDGLGETVSILRDVSLSASVGERIGIVGESGSGKSVLALSMLGLLPRGLSILRGSIMYDGLELVGLDERSYRSVRGTGIGMVFQDPMTALNPLRRIGSLLKEAARQSKAKSRGHSAESLESRSLTALTHAGFPNPKSRFRSYPHELSGGLRQRVGIALALVNEPRVLIFDEATTALDATVQAEILRLMVRLSGDRLLFVVTHDLGVAAEVCTRIIVLYAGAIVEDGDMATVLSAPAHPYTAALLRARPVFGQERRLPVGIPGSVPSPSERPKAGCIFATRCERVQPRCRVETPVVTDHRSTRAACWYPLGPEEAT